MKKKKIILKLKATAAEINVYRYEINKAESEKEIKKMNLV